MAPKKQEEKAEGESPLTADVQEKPKKEAKKKTGPIIIPKPIIRTIILFILGRSPLITNKWSNKAKMEIRAKQQLQAKPKRGRRYPVKEFFDAIYHAADPEGHPHYQFPAIAFKKSFEAVTPDMENVAKTVVNRAVQIVDEYVTIHCTTPQMREDTVKIGKGLNKVADLRYRPMYRKWKAELPLEVIGDRLAPEQLVHLAQYAGLQIGVGEWRPEKSGLFGRFEISTSQEEYDTYFDKGELCADLPSYDDMLAFAKSEGFVVTAEDVKAAFGSDIEDLNGKPEDGEETAPSEDEDE